MRPRHNRGSRVKGGGFHVRVFRTCYVRLEARLTNERLVVRADLYIVMGIRALSSGARPA